MFKCLRNFDDGSKSGSYKVGDEYMGKGESLKKCLDRGWVEGPSHEDEAPAAAAPEAEPAEEPKKKSRSKKKQED